MNPREIAALVEKRRKGLESLLADPLPCLYPVTLAILREILERPSSALDTLRQSPRDTALALADLAQRTAGGGRKRCLDLWDFADLVMVAMA